MELFTAIAAAFGAVSGTISAVGFLIVNTKLDRLIGRVDSQEQALAAHVNTPGLHR